AAGVDHGRTQDCQDLLTGGPSALHGGGNLAHGDSLGFFAGHRAIHELEQALARHGLGGGDAQALPADDDALALFYPSHGQATGRPSFRIEQDATVHFLILDIDPLASQSDLSAIIGAAVEALGEGAVHVSLLGGAVGSGHRNGAVIVNRIENFLEVIRVVGPDLDARIAAIG